MADIKKYVLDIQQRFLVQERGLGNINIWPSIRTRRYFQLISKSECSEKK